MSFWLFAVCWLCSVLFGSLCSLGSLGFLFWYFWYFWYFWSIFFQAFCQSPSQVLYRVNPCPTEILFFQRKFYQRRVYQLFLFNALSTLIIPIANSCSTLTNPDQSLIKSCSTPGKTNLFFNLVLCLSNHQRFSSIQLSMCQSLSASLKQIETNVIKLALSAEKFYVYYKSLWSTWFNLVCLQPCPAQLCSASSTPGQLYSILVNTYQHLSTQLNSTQQSTPLKLQPGLVCLFKKTPQVLKSKNIVQNRISTSKIKENTKTHHTNNL